jgi:hypothetical protein
VSNYNQGKNTREIAKELSMSFRDIGLILRKAAANLESENGKKQSEDSSSTAKPNIDKISKRQTP